jgi:molybdopterin-containing oxidoreductase family membrane subunit
MQERVIMSDQEINNELLRSVFEHPMRFWVGAGVLGCFVAAWLFALSWMIYWGLAVTGLNRPVYWGFMITNFVFWVGISHAGTMISSILRLTQAEWRRPVVRAAEVMTVFSLSTAALFPLIHTGRPWRAIMWVFPYDFMRDVWPNVRSPLIWDPSAIFTYLTGSALFVFTALIPDAAVIRDRSTGWRRTFYGALSLGWTGNTRQWKLQGIAGILISALILPVFVSVHSIVSWDFAVSIVPVWHATVFAPYFVVGAVHSGVSAVLTLMAAMRWMFKWEKFIRPEHFDAVGRLLIVIATVWLYFFFLDFVFAIATRETREIGVMERRVFEWPFWFLLVEIIILGYIIPVGMWLKRSVRRNIKLMFWSSLLVNIAMWSERYWLIVPGIERKYELNFTWSFYNPSLVEITLVIGSFGIVVFLLLMFSKFFPPIVLWEEKEGQKFAANVRVGQAVVPAIVKEE